MSIGTGSWTYSGHRLWKFTERTCNVYDFCVALCAGMSATALVQQAPRLQLALEFGTTAATNPAPLWTSCPATRCLLPFCWQQQPFCR